MSGKIPKRPVGHLTCLDGYSYEFHHGDPSDNRIITAVYRTRITPPGKREYVPPKPKPKWWQFWRWGERNLYNHW